MQVSRPNNSGFLDGLEVRTACEETIDRLLAKGVLTPREARVLRRAGRFQTIRVAGRGRNLYQDVETKEFWEMKEGAVVRLLAVDGDGVIAKEASRAAGGTTGYHRDKRMEQSPGTFNDGAGEKNTDKFAVDDADGLGEESAIGMRPDRDHQEKPFNADEGPGHAQTAAAEKPFKKGEWVTDGDEAEFQVADDQNPDGSVDVTDDTGNTEKHPLPQDLKRKSQPGVAPTPTASRGSAWAEGMKDNQVTDLIDFSLTGLPDRSAAGRAGEFGFLDEMDVSEVAAVTHREETDRIVASGEITRAAARAMRRVGRFDAAADMYRDTVTGDLWACDGDVVRRAERARTAAADGKRTATWNTIDSVLRRERGWVPEFQISDDREASGIHLENPSPDDVMVAIHVAREQGHRIVHVH